MIRALETRYGGHLFRSRLEARWAYAFDLMKIRWEYEPQGYECTTRLSQLGTIDGDQPTFPYLPDFWLPDHEVFAEVKGQLATEEEFIRLLDAVASLSSDGGGGCQDTGGNDVVLLGPISRPFNAPYGLHMHKGTLTAHPWNGYQHNTFCKLRGDEFVIAQDYGSSSWHGIGDTYELPRLKYDRREDWKHVSSLLLGGYYPLHGIKDAMVAASQARFEHGQTPDPVSAGRR